jgi:hypothetical protein
MKRKTPFFTLIGLPFRKNSPLATQCSLPESAKEVVAPFFSRIYRKKKPLAGKMCKRFLFS